VLRRTRRWKWLTQPAAIAALLVLTAAGGAIGGLAGGPAVGAGAGLLTALLLAFAVDRLTSTWVGPRHRRRTADKRTGQ
jgi:hypothetical protein